MYLSGGGPCGDLREAPPPTKDEDTSRGSDQREQRGRGIELRSGHDNRTVLGRPASVIDQVRGWARDELDAEPDSLICLDREGDGCAPERLVGPDGRRPVRPTNKVRRRAVLARQGERHVEGGAGPGQVQ